MWLFLSLLWSVLLLNLPWFRNDVFFVFSLPESSAKRLLLQLVQWMGYLAIVMGSLFALEYYLYGNVYAISWELGITLFLLSVIITFPGILYQIYKQT